MSGKLKWIAIAVVAVLLLLLIIPFLIPVNSFKPTLESRASAALGRKVEIGNLSLSLFTGSLGVDSISIADDPKFSSVPFLTAKSARVGVEMMPLIFSKELKVTGVTIENPQVTLLRDPSGAWNFSSIGNSSASTAPKSADSTAPGAVSIKKLEVKDGQITLGTTKSQKRSVYTNVNLTASDVASTTKFPIDFSMGLPGGGDMKIAGNVGPFDQKDVSLTPQDVKLSINNMNLASTGFLDPKLGLGGVVDVASTLVSQGGQMAIKGNMKLSKAVLIAGGHPSGVPASLDFDTRYDLQKSSGVLNPSVIRIGNAKSNLNGTYKSEGDNFVVDMKLDGQGLPATDLESFLPALAINLPDKSRLSAGTLNANLHLTGPTDNLVTDGTIGLFNGKLAGFDLGSKMSGVASLAGIKTGGDLMIEKFTSNVHMAPNGLRADNMNLVVPSLGSMVGSGTLDSKNNMNFNVVATVSSSMITNVAAGAAGAAGGTLGQVLGAGAANCKGGTVKVPLQIHGTTSNPQFTPDVGGATASLLKSQLGCVGGTTNAVQSLAGGALGTNNPAANDAINQLGGLLGGKKKKP